MRDTTLNSELLIDHIEGRGQDVYRLACERDLEGIVAKWRRGTYQSNRATSWLKIKNPHVFRGSDGRCQIVWLRLWKVRAAAALGFWQPADNQQETVGRHFRKKGPSIKFAISFAPWSSLSHHSFSELAALEAAGNLLKGLHLLRTAHCDHIKKTARK